MQNALDTGVVWGFTWWASHDIDPAIKGFAAPEYGLGLIDQKNHVKPLGRIVSEVARECRRQSFPPARRRVALVVPDTGLSDRPNDWTYATAYMNLIAKGKKPCIVRESRRNDKAYLKSRGVAELISLADAARV